MFTEKMQKALNRQLNEELHSAYLYLSMAAHLESMSLPGLARWLEVQAKEEVGHGMRLYQHINQRRGRVELLPIASVPSEWKTPLAIFEETLEHEQVVTRAIHHLVTQANEEKDYATATMLQAFVTEQVEEEATAAQLVESFKMVGDSPQGLFLLDRELGRRE